MLRRLTAFDLPDRFRRRVPPAVVRILTGFILASLAVLVRIAIETAEPGAGAFALLYPAILFATCLSGWEAGVVALATGVLFSWLFLMLPKTGWVLDLPLDLNLALHLLAGGLIIAVAAAYRAVALARRDSEERLALAIETARMGVWERRLDTFEVTYSEEAKRICGFPLDQPVTHQMVQDIVHPDDLPTAQLKFARALNADIRDNTGLEYRIVLPDGEVRWVYSNGRIIFEPDKGGRLVPSRSIGVVQDITARKSDEERLLFLAREVDHRANNLLAVVQGTVALSQADEPAALKRVISGRINAVACAHQLLSQARWEGADLHRLVKDELLAFSLGDEARVSLRGPTVTLSPAAAQEVAMVLHELATNAAKYGALSACAGHVKVTWRRDAEGALKIAWRESGGPKVEKPTHKGLGATLLERALSGPIQGGTSLDWRPEGLVCELMLPAAALKTLPAATTLQ
jgi:PAS domain S-box-containing protein